MNGYGEQKLQVLVSLIIFFFAFNFSKQVLASPLPELLKMDSTRSGQEFTTELHFSSDIKKENVSIDYINETIQLNVEGAKFSTYKKFEPIEDQKVKSLYTYQADESLLRHRVILKKGSEAVNFNGLVQVEVIGPVVRAVIGREVLPSKLKKASTSPIDKILNSLPEPIHQVTLKKEIRTETPKLVIGGNERGAAPSFDVKGDVKSDMKSNDEFLLENEKELLAKVERMRSGDRSKTKAAGRELAVSSKSKKSTLEKNGGLFSEKSLEESIPAFKGEVEKSESKESPYGRMMMSMVIVLIVSLVAFLGIKKYTNKGMLKNKHTSIKVLTQHHLGPKKSLAIISVAGESILVGVTDYNITHIKNLALLEEEVPQVSNINFDDVMTGAGANNSFVASMSQESTNESSNSDSGSIKNKTSKEVDSFGLSENSARKVRPEAGEEFSMAGIKDIVSTKLKNMREI